MARSSRPRSNSAVLNCIPSMLRVKWAACGPSLRRGRAGDSQDTKSAFTGYIKDKLTTLKPATDRIFGTRATVKWEYAASAPHYAQVRARIIAALLKEFAAHDSLSVLQHTLFDMGRPRWAQRRRLHASRSLCPISTSLLART